MWHFFLEFSNNYLCLVIVHWFLLSLWRFIVDIADDNNLHETWLAFCWLTSTLDYWKSCNYSSLSSGLCRKREAFFFFFSFFYAPPRPSLDMKKWIMLWKHSWQNTKMHKSWTISVYDKFASSSKVILQCMLRLRRHPYRFSSTILSFHVGIFYLCLQNKHGLLCVAA